VFRSKRNDSTWLPQRPTGLYSSLASYILLNYDMTLAWCQQIVEFKVIHHIPSEMNFFAVNIVHESEML